MRLPEVKNSNWQKRNDKIGNLFGILVGLVMEAYASTSCCQPRYPVYGRELAKIDDVKTVQKDEVVQLLDVRDLKYYVGDEINKALVLPQGRGHIPSALNMPQSQLTRGSGDVLQVQDLVEITDMAEMMDVDLSQPSILYCDSGNYASLAWFVIHELLGNNSVRLYDGSMHQWSTFSLPVNIGDTP